MPHGRNRRCNLGGIGYRKRAALTDTDEGRACWCGLQFFLRRVRRRQVAGVRRAKNDAVEIRQFQRRFRETPGVGTGHHDLGGPQPQVEGVEQRDMTEQIALRA